MRALVSLALTPGVYSTQVLYRGYILFSFAFTHWDSSKASKNVFNSRVIEVFFISVEYCVFCLRI